MSRKSQYDLVELEKLAAMYATDVEIAHWFRVAIPTFDLAKRRPEIAAV